MPSEVLQLTNAAAIFYSHTKKRMTYIISASEESLWFSNHKILSLGHYDIYTRVNLKQF
jgi:hypothetical protein